MLVLIADFESHLSHTTIDGYYYLCQVDLDAGVVLGTKDPVAGTALPVK